VISDTPSLWLIAGPNGAGKSTFYEKHLRAHVPHFVNADVIGQGLDLLDQAARDREAMRLAEQQRQALLAAGQTFAAETVFSHPSKVDLIRQAKAAGFDVHLVFIATEEPAINRARVRQRVQLGGHDVPVEKIAPRYERALANLRDALPLVDHAYLYDNSRVGEHFRLVIEVEGGAVRTLAQPLPQWVQRTFPHGVRAHLDAAFGRMGEQQTARDAGEGDHEQGTD